MGNFYTDILRHSYAYNKVDRQNSLDLLEPVTRKKVQAIISDAKSHGFNLMMYETFRSSKRQEELFKQKATELEHVGVHGFGLAADIVHDINGQPSWDDLHIVYHLAIAHNLVSGQNWHYPDPPNPRGFFDGPHVQRISLKDQDRLFNGLWYPDESYKPY